MPKIIDSIAHNRRAAATTVSYDKSALRNIGDVAAWNRDRLIDDILIGKAAEFKEELPWEFDGRAHRALLFDRDIAVSYHIEHDVQHYGTGQNWILTKYEEGRPRKIGSFKSGPDYFSSMPIEQAKSVALDDWNRNYAAPSERSYLHLAKSNREVLRAAILNDARGDVIIKAQTTPTQDGPEYVAHHWLDEEGMPGAVSDPSGVEILMMWNGHNIVYSYEFSGHGDPYLIVDGKEMPWDELQTMFGIDSDEVFAIISDAANQFTPEYPSGRIAMRPLDTPTIELCKLLEPEILPIMAKIRSGEFDRFQGMGVIKHICSQNGISFAQFEQYRDEKNNGKHAQMGPGTLPPMDTPKLESQPDDQGQHGNGNQPAGTGKHPVNYQRPLSGESIPGTGMIGVGKGTMGVAAQAAPPAPPAAPAPAAEPNAEVGQESVDPNAPPAEAAPVDDGMSLIDALADAQNALDSIKQKIDSGETVINGQEVESVEDAPEPGIQPQINQPAGAAPITAKKTRVGQSNHEPYGAGNMQMVMLQEKRGCECESMNCHPNLDCMSEADGKNVTIYGTGLCDECASKMPTKFMKINQGVEMGRKGQVTPPPLPGTTGLDLPNDDEIDTAFDEATSGPAQPPLADLLAVYDNIMAQAKDLEKQMAALKEQGKIMMVDHLAPIMRELEGQQIELDGKIRKLSEWTQDSVSYGKVFDDLFGQLGEAQQKLATELKAKYTNQSIRQEIRTEKPGKPKKQGDDMGDAGVLAALNDIVALYEKINAAADTVLGAGMSMGAAIGEKVCASCEEGNHQRCAGRCDCGCPNSKQAVDDSAAKYYTEYYKTYGEQLTSDPREARIALIIELAATAGVTLLDEDVVKYMQILEARPMVHGAFLRYAASSTEPTMDDMVQMVFEKSQSDPELSRILDGITIKHLLQTSDLINRMTPEEQMAILGRAMRGNKRFYNRIEKLYRRALGIEDPTPEPAPEAQPTVPQAGPEILTAALRIMAAGMPKMTAPTVRKGEDDAVDVIKMEDLAKDTDVSVPSAIPFEHETPTKRGKYMYMTIKWDTDDVKVSGNSLVVALKKYVQSIVSHRWPVDFGYSYTPVIEEVDPEAGTAIVYFQAATKGDAPLEVTGK